MTEKTQNERMTAAMNSVHDALVIVLDGCLATLEAAAFDDGSEPDTEAELEAIGISHHMLAAVLARMSYDLMSRCTVPEEMSAAWERATAAAELAFSDDPEATRQ